MTQTLTLRRPDDWHLHLRDGAMLRAVLPESARHFARAIIMPNLVPPVVTSHDALAYRDRIMAALPEGANFAPLMTLYLTEQTDPDDVAAAHKSGLISAVKLDPVRRATPGLRVVMEHITTRDGVDYVQSNAQDLAATITTHHLVINRNHILVGGIKPHYYCLPVAKREEHRLALRAAATSGNARFFLGTDSAPHTDSLKESACGCAGCFTASNTMSILAHVFEEEGALDRLEGFTSLHGPIFYGQPPNEAKITLTKGDPVQYPDKIATEDGPVTVFDPGFALHWQVT